MVAKVPSTLNAEEAPCSWKALLAMPRAAEQQANPTTAVQHQHHGSEHGVSRQRPAADLGCQHHRNDQGDLDHRHRDGKNDRTDRFADS